jgi:hypothetical protein
MLIKLLGLLYLKSSPRFDVAAFRDAPFRSRTVFNTVANVDVLVKISVKSHTIDTS